ncbi:MAG: hypothetical protein NT155_01055 [Candidatus Staskawiczbacteria bacterium]|nr:hypothetical protein [Candidatus Staskawiczbacteria bacterium]
MFFKKWFRQRKLAKLEKDLVRARSLLASYKGISSSAADSFLTWQAWAPEGFYSREVSRLEQEIQSLR